MTETMFLVLAGAAVTYVWRGLGVLLATRIDADGAIAQWVGCVSYALLAALISRMIILPTGDFAETSLLSRLAAVAVGVALVLVLRRNLLWPVMAGTAVFWGMERVLGS